MRIGVRSVGVRVIPCPRGHLATASYLNVLPVADQGGFSCIAGGLGRVPTEIAGLAPVTKFIARVAGHRSGRRDLKLLQSGRRFDRGVRLGRTGAARTLVRASKLDNATSHLQNEDEYQCGR